MLRVGVFARPLPCLDAPYIFYITEDLPVALQLPLSYCQSYDAYRVEAEGWKQAKEVAEKKVAALDKEVTTVKKVVVTLEVGVGGLQLEEQ
jgi:hypothetical protein